MKVLIFEDDRWGDFRPFTSTRHVGQQVLGARSTIEHLSAGLDEPPSLAGRIHLAQVVREETGLVYNEGADGRVLAINARVNPLADLGKLTKKKAGAAILHGDDVAAAVLSRADFERTLAPDSTIAQRKLRQVAKRLERLQSDQPMFSYPWEMLEANEAALRAMAPKRGTPALSISPGAEVEEFVSFDPSTGPIVIEERARIESFSRLTGPCYIGPKTIVHSALIRGGTSIGADCRIGGEVDHSIVYGHSNKAHSGYLGHSIVGEWVNLGAGSETSDLKSTYGTVRVATPSGRVDTGLLKLGALIGDMAKVSVGTMLYGGKVLGVSAHASGLVDLDVPDFTSYDGYRRESFDLTLASVVQTAGRMMARRNLALTPAREALIERIYAEPEQPPLTAENDRS